MRRTLLVVLLAAAFIAVAASPAFAGIVPGNLITNGHFESGNVGFTSDYRYVSVASRAGGQDNLGSLSPEEVYAIGLDPWLYHALWTSFKDHTFADGTGLMMIVNGNDVPVTPLPVVYRTESAATVPGQIYDFSFWGATSYPAAYANLDVFINGANVGSFTAPSAVAAWSEFSCQWVADDTKAIIEIVDTNMTHTGNDFALDDVVLTPVPDPKINVEKDGEWVDADSDGHAEAGEKIEYTFTVTNAGNVPLTGVTVTDPLLDAAAELQSGDSEPLGELGLTETWIYKGVHTLTQEEIDAGTPETIDLDALKSALPVTATLRVSGNGTADDEAYFPITTLTNAGSLNGTYDGWCIDLDHTISQNANYASHIYSSYDPALPAGIVEHPENLPMVNWILNQDFQYKSAGVGNAPQTYSSADIQKAIWTLLEDTVPANQAAGSPAPNQLRVDKIVALAMEHPTYVPPCNGVVAIIVQPDGTSHPQLIGVQATLIPIVGHCETSFHNTVTADSTESPPDTDDDDEDLPKHPSVTIDKVTVDGDTKGDGLTILVGDAISWEYTVTNTGNVTLHNILVRDSDVAADIGTIVELAPGASATLTRTGTAVGGAYANGSSADPDECPAATDRSWYTGVGLTISKVTVDGSRATDGGNINLGESIKWRYTVKAVGAPVTGVQVSDSVSGVNPQLVSGDTNGDSILQTSETWIYEAEGTAIKGRYDNTGTATAAFTDSAGHSGLTKSDTSYYVGVDPKISINKVTVDGSTSGDALNILVGESIKWRYTVKNEGNVTLSNVVVEDNMGVTPVRITADSDNKLVAGQTWIYEATGVSVAGDYSNTATATATYLDSAGHDGAPEASDTSNYVGAAPSVTIDKKTNGADDGGYLAVGAPITWTYEVKNTSGVTLRNIVVTDDNGTPEDTTDDVTVGTILALLADASDSVQRTGTAVDGEYTNVGKASWSFADSAGHSTSGSATDSSGYEGGYPEVSLTKSVDDNEKNEPGGTFNYTILITNEGELPFNITYLHDTQYDISGYEGTVLDEDESLKIEYSIDHHHEGTWPNTASVIVEDEQRNGDDASDSETVSVVNLDPVVTVTKTAGRTLVPGPTAWVEYTFTVKNDSVEAVTLTELSDDKFGDLLPDAEKKWADDGNTAPIVLASGASFTFTKGFEIARIDGDPHVNEVTATVVDDEDNPDSDTDDASVDFFDGSVVTNTSYCSFDMDPLTDPNEFRLIYRPETNTTFILNGQNPGQFYYNAFVSGEPGTEFTLTLEIPFPFVNHGANPTHVYSDFDVHIGDFGPCFVPKSDVTGNFDITTEKGVLSASGAEVIVLGDYTPQEFGSSTKISVVGTVPVSGFAYVTSHLEYGLIKISPWYRSLFTATNLPLLLGGGLDPNALSIKSPMPYTFNSSVSGDTGIESLNVFKKVAGALGEVLGANTGDPLANLTVDLWTGDGRTKLASGLTDEDGYYTVFYKYTGKATNFIVKIPKLGLSKTITLKANGFMICDFEVVGR